jgi:hypothetical protein
MRLSVAAVVGEWLNVTVFQAVWFSGWLKTIDALGDLPAGVSSLWGLIGRFTKPPPQLGQTLCSTHSTQAAQNVHS